jgi:hypothetical protein
LRRLEDWREAWAALAREREAYGVDPIRRFPILFGITEVEGLREFLFGGRGERGRRDVLPRPGG